jgi:hypothetical protein
MVARFLGHERGEEQISRLRRSRLREDGSGRDDALRGLACEGLRWRRRGVMISTARVRDVGAIGLKVCGKFVLMEPRA